MILDIMLPDIDGFEVCRNIRTNARTNHVCIIFLTQKDERSDKLQGFELGADDYVTKPFEIEELKVRVYGAIRRSERDKKLNSRTGLPSERIIEDQLRHINDTSDWCLLDIKINNFESFQKHYGIKLADEVLDAVTNIINDSLRELGVMSDSFVGQLSDDNFIVITNEKYAPKFELILKEKFALKAQIYYNSTDQKQGFEQLSSVNGTVANTPLMSISTGMVKHDTKVFGDMREIFELASEARQKDSIAQNFEEWKLRNTNHDDSWTYIYLRIKHLDAYKEVYGTTKSNEVIWQTAKMIKEVIGNLKIPDNFFGHEAKDKYVIILPQKYTLSFCENLRQVFNSNIESFYYYIHYQQGYVRTDDQTKHPFMELSMVVAHSNHQDLTDIGNTTEFAQFSAAIDK